MPPRQLSPGRRSQQKQRIRRDQRRRTGSAFTASANSFSASPGEAALQKIVSAIDMKFGTSMGISSGQDEVSVGFLNLHRELLVGGLVVIELDPLQRNATDCESVDWS